MAKPKIKLTAKRKNKNSSAGRWIIILLLLSGGMGAGSIWLYLQSRYPVKGIDVSHHNDSIDWKVVKTQSIRFAFIKATEGKTMVDENFQGNWKGCKEAGIMRGAYHYFIPTLDGKEQAENFLANVKFEKGDLPPVLDLEVTNGKSAKEISAGALTWLKTVEERIGVKPILYSLPSFSRKYLASGFESYPLWIVDIGLFKPDVPTDWSDWTFWQYSHSGKLKGMKGKVDLNFFNGSMEELGRLESK